MLRTLSALVICASLATPALAESPPFKLEAKPGNGMRMAQTDDGKVNMDFPEKTAISDISKAIALWTGKPLILDRGSSQGKVKINAPERVSKDEAWKLYEKALTELKLVAVEQHGVVRVVPARSNPKVVHDYLEGAALPKLPPTENLVVLDADSPTEITDVIKKVESWSKVSFAYDRRINGKVQIFSPKPMEKEQAYRVFQAALATLGYGERAKDGKVEIVPMNELAQGT